MKFEKTYYESSQEYTKEMEDWFISRTNRHIDLVKKYAKLIEEYDPIRFKGLSEISENHDKSKFEDDVEKIPYIFISWKYHSQDIGKEFSVPKHIEDNMHKATIHHVKNNKHHPEYFDESSEINKADRDKPPEELVDATTMADINIAEMLADWMAMSEEKGNTVKEWADKNVNIRWQFTEDQTNLIYELINNVGE